MQTIYPSKEDITALGMRYLDYVEVESPEFVKEITTDNRDIAKLIDHYDLIWTLAIDESYAKRRGWNDLLAFREILQNALDIEHEIYGYDRINVIVRTDELGTWVKDHGSGLPYRAFMLGGEDKPCYARGAFGEGLKIAALWFSSKGHPLYIFTFDTVYKCVYSKRAKALIILIGKSKPEMFWEGTAVLIYRYRPPRKHERIYFKTAGFNVLSTHYYPSSQCDYDMPNSIMKPKGYLYVRDILVNTIKEVTGKNSLFSYNLWWVKLEPNRVQVQSFFEFEDRVAELLCKDLEALKHLIDECIVGKTYGGINYYVLEEKYFETLISYTYADLPVTVKEGLANYLKSKYHVSAYSVHGDLDGVTAVNHEGGTCILVPERMKRLFVELKEASEFVLDSIGNMVKGARVIDKRTLDQSKRSRLRMYELIKEFIVETRDVKIQIASGYRSYYTGRTIYLSSVIPSTETFIHELAHALGERLYEDAPDVSENFERALEYVGSGILSMMFYETWHAAMKRASYGAIFAQPHDKPEYFGDVKFYLDSYDPARLHSLYELPSRFVAADAIEKRIVLFGHIGVGGVPVEEKYREKINEDIDFLLSFYSTFKGGGYSLDEAKREFNDHFRSFLGTEQIKYILNAIEIGRVFYYNMEADRYELLRL